MGKNLKLPIERFRKRADIDRDHTDMIIVFIHVSRVLDFVWQTLGMYHLSALAFIIFSDKHDRKRPCVLYTAFSHRFACK